MRFIREYRRALDNLIMVANLKEIPYEGLHQHKKEFEVYIKQQNCKHNPEPTKMANGRIWKCIKCNKFIENETIK